MESNGNGHQHNHQAPQGFAAPPALSSGAGVDTEERWEDLWNTYTSDFRERCSFDAMIEVIGELRAQGVVRFEVAAFDEIEFIGDAAQATYSVVGFDQDDRQTASYNYDTTLVKEDGEWRFEESCF